ncbi:unnamed protein product [Dicrocoelium dendriticum]|nr:unnamed protein product [Dicrocoelium dendriticum]
MATFNVRTLRQTGQQAALARTLDTLGIDVCCVSETRINDPNGVIELTAPGLSSRYWLHASGDADAALTGQAGVGIILSSKAEPSLVDWIPVNSRLCAARLTTSAKVDSRSSTKRCLFVISAYAPTDCSSNAVKDTFYHELNALLRSATSSDIIVLAGDMNAQVGRLSSSEAQLGGNYGLNSERTDNGERLLQLCAEHQLFLSSTAFRHSGRRSATWRPPVAGQRWTQIDHIAISYRWRGSILDCRSYWSTCVDSDHALVRCRFSMNFTGRRTKRPLRLATEKLSQSSVRQAYQEALRIELPLSCPNDTELQWNRISAAMHDAGASACGTISRHRTSHWISERSVNLLESRRHLPAGSEHNVTRRAIRRELKRSLRADKEAWWTSRAQEMEEQEQ